MDSWDLLIDPPMDGEQSMRTDGELLDSLTRGEINPTLRLYQWDRPTVTLGFRQREEETVDTAFCRERGIPVVRRPTGGRAILHDQELSYSVLAPTRGPHFPDGLQSSYGKIHRILCGALRNLGIPAELHGTRPERTYSKNPSCFAGSARDEIGVFGKKICGSAQRRTRNAFLQQGSILFSLDPDLNARCFRFGSEEQREAFLETLRRGTIGISNCSGKMFPVEQLIGSVLEAFQTALGVQFTVAGAC